MILHTHPPADIGGTWQRKFALFPILLGTEADGRKRWIWLDYYEERRVYENRDYECERRPISIPMGFSNYTYTVVDTSDV